MNIRLYTIMVLSLALLALVPVWAAENAIPNPGFEELDEGGWAVGVGPV